jgi:hypothetical protein
MIGSGNLSSIFCLLFIFFLHADVHATACWRIGSYAPGAAVYQWCGFKYQTDLTCNLDEFKREIARWRTRWRITPRDQMPHSLCAVNPVLYPSIDTILCTTPIPLSCGL